MGNPIFTSPLLGTTVTLGNLAIWLGLLFAVTTVVLYWTAMLRTMRRQPAVASANGAETPANGEGKPAGKKNGKRAAAQVAAQSAHELKTERISRWARRFFYAASACMLIGAVCLWTLIFNQQYNVQYIW